MERSIAYTTYLTLCVHLLHDNAVTVIQRNWYFDADKPCGYCIYAIYSAGITMGRMVDAQWLSGPSWESNWN